MTVPPVSATPSNRRQRMWREWWLLAVALSTLAGCASWFGWFQRIDAAIYDGALRLWERPPAADIVIVSIDDESLRQIGRWPWPRGVHATLLPRLGQARGVFLDVLFLEPEGSAPDRGALLSAVRDHGRVVLPVQLLAASATEAIPTLPVAELAAAAARLAHIHVDTDRDGLLRRVHLAEGVGAQRFPHAAVALLELGGNRAAPAPAAGPDPAGRGQWWRIDEFPLAFVGPPGRFVRIPYVSVLRGDVPESFFRDRFVLVGATAAGLGDLFATPVGSSGKLMPGVEINAQVLQQLREGVRIRELPDWTPATVAVVIVLMTMLANASLAPRRRLFANAGIALALVAGSALALRWVAVWVPPAAAAIAALSVYPLWSWRRLESAQAFLDGELERLREALQPGRRGSATADVGDPLERRIEAIEAANAELARNARAREDAMAFLTHDMRAPQVSILALIETYRNLRGGAVDDKFWRRLDMHARNTLSLAEDFVQITRAEHLDPAAGTAVNLCDIATEAGDDAWARTAANQVRIQRTLPDEAWVHADRALLSRAVRNLIDNAIKHAPAGSTIDIGISRHGSAWRLSVADEGEGVPDERKEAIFQRFDVGHLTSAKAGAGLGLALVRTAAARFGGQASVEDASPRGARFVITLPALPDVPG